MLLEYNLTVLQVQDDQNLQFYSYDARGIATVNPPAEEWPLGEGVIRRHENRTNILVSSQNAATLSDGYGKMESHALLSLVLPVLYFMAHNTITQNKDEGLLQAIALSPQGKRQKKLLCVQIQQTVHKVGRHDSSSEAEPNHRPLVAGCNIGHKPRLFHVSGWDMGQAKESNIFQKCLLTF